MEVSVTRYKNGKPASTTKLVRSKTRTAGNAIVLHAGVR